MQHPEKLCRELPYHQRTRTARQNHTGFLTSGKALRVGSAYDLWGACVLYEARRKRRKKNLLGRWNVVLSARKLIFLGSVTHGIVHAFTQLHIVLLPVFLKEFGMTILQAGLIVSLGSLVEMIMGIPSGIMGDRYRHLPLIACFMLLGMGGILQTQVGNFYMLAAVICLIHMCSALYHYPYMAILSRQIPENDIGKAFGLHGAGATVGNALGPMSLGLIMAALFGWRVAYAIWSIPAFIAVLILIRAFRGYEYSFVSDREKKKGDSASSKADSRLRSILNRDFLVIMSAAGIRSLATRSVIIFLSVYFVTIRGLSISESSFIIGLGALVGTVGISAGGFLSDMSGQKTWLTIAYLSQALSLLALVFSPTRTWAVLSFFLHNFFSSGGSAAVDSVVSVSSPMSRRGLAFALFYTPFDVMSAVSPTIAAVLVEALGLWYLFPFASMLCILSIFPVRMISSRQSSK